MDIEKIEQIVQVLRKSSQLAEIEIRSGDTVLRLRRPAPDKSASLPVPRAVLSPRPAAPNHAAAAPVLPPSAVSEGKNGSSGVKSVRVSAPLVGVFRASRKQTISPGASVAAEQVLGHIEAMRLMNDCSAPVAGTVTDVFVQDGQPVEYGQPLFDIVEGKMASATGGESA